MELLGRERAHAMPCFYSFFVAMDALHEASIFFFVSHLNKKNDMAIVRSSVAAGDDRATPKS